MYRAFTNNSSTQNNLKTITFALVAEDDYINKQLSDHSINPSTYNGQLAPDICYGTCTYDAQTDEISCDYGDYSDFWSIMEAATDNFQKPQKMYITMTPKRLSKMSIQPPTLVFQDLMQYVRYHFMREIIIKRFQK